MKILMLGWELPPHNSGGLGVACLNMARALCREGADIDFVIPYTAEHSEIDFMNVISATELDPIYRYGGGAYDGYKIAEKIIPTAVADQYMSIRDVQKSYQKYLIKHLSDFNPDVIHAHDWLTYEAGMTAKKMLGKPLIVHVHATEFDRAGMHAGNPLIHEIEYEGLMMADEIIAVSESTKRIIHEKYHIPLSKIDVVYNTLDEGYDRAAYRFDNNLYRYLLHLKSNGYTIVSTVGRFTIQKGLHYLMNAAALAIHENPQLMFVFAGDGEERNDLIAEAARLGISRNVIFTGFIRGRKLRDIYAVTDVFVMSSVSEPFGLTALEAAHHGDALILSNQSGVSEIIWSALKYDAWDTRKLAEEIVAVSRQTALREALTQNVRNEYHQISWDDIAKKCLKIYNKNINKRGLI
ncbi:glycosyltransferase family 4 protein [Candidatus Saccharibacteria bacterium]|nr:glycosyltransferase family 4 protein [Candidatus Saccharibacteria bacterium]